MLMNLIGQLSAINQYNNAAMAGMQARESHLSMMRGIKINSGSPAADTLSFGSMAMLAAGDKHLQATEIQSNFIMTAMEAWQKSLKEQAKNRKDDTF